MKDFKKFTVMEQHPTTATNSTEVKPTSANAEEKELGWELPVNNIRRDLYNLFQILIARNYNNIGKWRNEVQQYNFELISEIEKILIDNPPQPSPSEEPTKDTPIFIDGDFNSSYSLMTSTDPAKREKGKQIRVVELSKRLAASEALVRDLKDEVKALNEELTVTKNVSESYKRALVKLKAENHLNPER